MLRRHPKALVTRNPIHVLYSLKNIHKTKEIMRKAPLDEETCGIRLRSAREPWIRGFDIGRIVILSFLMCEKRFGLDV